MKSLLIAGLVAGQLLATAQPVLAADFAEARDVRTGAFAGLRLRMPLGADPERRGVQVGLTVAPTLRSTNMDGRSRMGIGEGIELGIRQRETVTLRLAGTRIDRLGMAEGNRAPQGHRHGVSTLGWIAIGVGTIVLAAAVSTAVFVHEMNESSD
ncbi:MAG TPA: hypothetical protein VIT38_06800 [Allosphingosinicella sp.]|jgi:hypothetical protein